MSDFTAFIPKVLLARALAFHGEYAWSRPDALDVIAIAEQEGFSILGVDIWIPSPSGAPVIPAPFVYDWSAENWKSHPDVAKSADTFVRSFEWDPTDAKFLDDAPYFNLTVGERRS